MSDSKQPGMKGGGSVHNEEKQTPDVRYVPVEYGAYPHGEEDEISLIDLVRTLWDGRRIIIICTAFFAFLGLFYYLFSAREYESDAVMIQEQQQSGGGAGLQLLQQFGGGGGSFDMMQEGIPSSLYPDILYSADFLRGVINYEVQFDNSGTTATPLYYFNEVYSPPLTERAADFVIDYTIKLPITLYRGVRGLFRSEAEEFAIPEQLDDPDVRFLSLSSEERRAIREMRDRIELEMSGGLVTFKTSMPDPKAAAELNHYIIERMQDYIINYRIEKYRQNLDFVEKQKADARERYEEAQLELARFNDRNVTITTNVARTQQEDLQNRRNVTYNVYNNLAQELEQARIRLQEETPVFNILQRPSLPHNLQGRSEIILVLTVFVGVIFGVFAVFAVNAWRVIREHLSDES